MSRSEPHLEVHLRHRVGILDLTIDLTAVEPWTVLFGPSGSGKTTILRAVAGLLRPAEGRIVLRRSDRTESQIATDTATRTFLEPHQRWTRWSAQTAVLFPNLTVLANLACGIGRQQDADIGIADALESFRLTRLAKAYPASLSGGERQRVSVARAAIAARGRLLMLDEPFSGLDAPLRDSLIEDLRRFLKRTNTPVLSVTHDLGEAFQLANEVIRIGDGRVLARGTAAAVLCEERARLIAQLSTADDRLRTPNRSGY